MFSGLTRQKFRRYFQPSRILLAVVPAPTESGCNIITLSFNMYCSYKPVMMAVAIQDINKSHALIKATQEFVLSVPGGDMAAEAMACGRKSLTDTDKVKELSLDLVPSKHVAVPGLARALANIELQKRALVDCGDHVLVVGEVLRFAVNERSVERPLLSIGPDTRGFRVLSHEGMHRLAVVDVPES